MSAPSRFLRGSRTLLAAARSAASAPKTSIPPSSSKKSAAAAAAASPPPKSPKKKKTSNPNSGITKSIPVSLALQNFMGVQEISRVEAVKKIWAYIKDNNLQNPLNKKEIFCDANLKKLFDGRDKVGFLEVAKLLSPHFVKTG